MAAAVADLRDLGGLLVGARGRGGDLGLLGALEEHRRDGGVHDGRGGGPGHRLCGLHINSRFD